MAKGDYKDRLPAGKHHLIVFEGSAKCDTVAAFLPELEKKLGTKVRLCATGGHFLSTPKESLGIAIDYENGKFDPKYAVAPDKKELVESLRGKISACLKSGGQLLILTDNDRAGEFIAGEIITHFKLKLGTDCLRAGLISPDKRDVFETLDKLAPALNVPLMLSEKARLVLDKCFGYVQSPHLWNLAARTSPADVQKMSDSLMKNLASFKELNKELLWDKRVKEFVKETEGLAAGIADLANDRKALSENIAIGRVQIPMLRLAVEAYLESFGKIKTSDSLRLMDSNGLFWKYSPESKKDGTAEDVGNSETEDDGDLAAGSDADEAYADVKDVPKIEVVSSTERTKRAKPPIPYNDRSLQSDAMNLLGMGPEEIADVSQKMYEQGITSYYRSKWTGYTDSSHENVAGLVSDAGFRVEKRRYQLPPEAGHDGIHTIYSKRIFLGEDGLYCPEAWSKPGAADRKFRRLFDLIHRRTLASMMPDFVTRERVTVGTANGRRFEVRTNVVEDAGFAEAYHWYLSAVPNSVSSETASEYAKGGSLEIKDRKLEKGKFKFSSNITVSSFGKKLEKLRIGTPATSVPIYKLIRAKGYVKETDDLKIKVLAKGFVLYSLTKGYDVFDIELTERMEGGLEDVETGRVTFPDFMSETFYERFVKNGFWDYYRKYLGKKAEWIPMNADKTDKKCPKCGKPVLKKTVRSKKNGKEYVVFECSDGKWDAKEKKKTGCDYSKFA